MADRAGGGYQDFGAGCGAADRRGYSPGILRVRGGSEADEAAPPASPSLMVLAARPKVPTDADSPS